HDAEPSQGLPESSRRAWHVRRFGGAPLAGASGVSAAGGPDPRGAAACPVPGEDGSDPADRATHAACDPEVILRWADHNERRVLRPLPYLPSAAPRATRG